MEKDQPGRMTPWGEEAAHEELALQLCPQAWLPVDQFVPLRFPMLLKINPRPDLTGVDVPEKRHRLRAATQPQWTGTQGTLA